MTTTAKWGWGILVALCGLLVLNGAGLYLFIVETQIERTIGLLLVAVGALGLMAALEGRRHGTRWAWTTTWVLVATMIALAAHMFRSDRVDLQITYVFLAALALTGQLLARKEVRS